MLLLEGTATTATAPTVSRHPSAYYREFGTAATDSFSLISQLDELLTLENVNGYTFQASPYAYENAKRFLETAVIIMGRTFPQPDFIPDGEGGIDVEWNRNARSLTLSCRGSNSQDDYLYWEENGRHKAEDADMTSLIYRLNWLNDA